MNFWASLFRTSGEREALDVVFGRLNGRAPILFDVGANIGDYTAMLLDRFGSSAKIFAFEPSLGAFGALSEKFDAVPSVTLSRLALSDASGDRTLHSDADGSTIASLENLESPIRPFDPDHFQTVACMRLDDYCAEHAIARIDFLKVDVEGHELSVLRGATRLLASRAIDVIQFEFGEPNIDSRTFMRDFVNLLQGYDFFRIVPGGPVPWTYAGGRSEIFATINYLAVRRDA
ncbi:hypothetical protein ASG11_08880 [Sphingomonas sp. Leaf357]|nr:hypothetical protein ASG11_08880 [Sphingomonas sp. Leaf357]